MVRCCLPAADSVLPSRTSEHWQPMQQKLNLSKVAALGGVGVLVSNKTCGFSSQRI